MFAQIISKLSAAALFNVGKGERIRLPYLGLLFLQMMTALDHLRDYVESSKEEMTNEEKLEVRHMMDILKDKMPFHRGKQKHEFNPNPHTTQSSSIKSTLGALSVTLCVYPIQFNQKYHWRTIRNIVYVSNPVQSKVPLAHYQ